MLIDCQGQWHFKILSSVFQMSRNKITYPWKKKNVFCNALKKKIPRLADGNRKETKRKGLVVAGPRPQRRAHVRTRGDRLQGPVAVQLPDQRQGTGEREARPGRPGPALRGGRVFWLILTSFT